MLIYDGLLGLGVQPGEQAFAAEQRVQVSVVEQPLSSGEPSRYAGDPHGDLRRCSGRRAGDHRGAGCVGRRGCVHRWLGRGCRLIRQPGGAHGLTVGAEQGQGLDEASGTALFRMVRVGGPVGPTGEDVAGEAGQRPLGTDLHEGAHAAFVHAFDDPDPLHRRGHLTREEIEHLLFARGIEVGRDVAVDGPSGRADALPLEHLAQGRARRGHHPGVEGVGYGDLHAAQVGLFEALHGLVHGTGFAGDDRLGRAVFVGGDHIAVHLFEQGDHPIRRGGHHGHGTRVVALGHRATHLLAPGRDDAQRPVHGQHARRHGGRIFAQGVARYHVRREPQVRKDPQQGDIGGEHRGLGHGGLHERHGGGTRGSLVLQGGLSEDVVRKRAAQDRGHDRVCFGEGCAHGGQRGFEVAEHAHVLAALPREEERHLRCGTFAQVGASAGQLDFAFARFQEAGELIDTRGQLFGVRRGNGHAYGRIVDGLPVTNRQGRKGRGLVELVSQGRELDRQVLAGRGAEAEETHVGQRHGGGDFPGVVRCVGRIRLPGRAHSRGVRTVLLEHHVEVGAAKAEGADTGPAGQAIGRLPGLELGLHPYGHVRLSEGLVGVLIARRWGQDALLEGKHGFDQARGAGRALQMSDVGFHRAQGHRAAGQGVEV